MFTGDVTFIINSATKTTNPMIYRSQLSIITTTAVKLSPRDMLAFLRAESGNPLLSSIWACMVINHGNNNYTTDQNRGICIDYYYFMTLASFPGYKGLGTRLLMALDA